LATNNLRNTGILARAPGPAEACVIARDGITKGAVAARRRICDDGSRMALRGTTGRGAVMIALAIGCNEPAGGTAEGEATTDGECGTLACDDELQISLVAQGGVFEGGEYTVATDVDGVVASCGFSMSGEASDCFGDPPCAVANDCEAEFGFAVMPHFVLLHVPGAGEVVRLGVARDTSTLVDVTLVPEYEDYWPNGSDCPPMCKVASASVDVP
jgi:hypothetical protein